MARNKWVNETNDAYRQRMERNAVISAERAAERLLTCANCKRKILPDQPTIPVPGKRGGIPYKGPIVMHADAQECVR